MPPRVGAIPSASDSRGDVAHEHDPRGWIDRCLREHDGHLVEQRIEDAFAFPELLPAQRPALRAAGLAQRGIYTMRHTFATWAIEAGTIPLPQVAAIMGTSIRELEDTYHCWLRRTDERLLAALDGYDSAAIG